MFLLIFTESAKIPMLYSLTKTIFKAIQLIHMNNYFECSSTLKNHDLLYHALVKFYPVSSGMN